MGPIGVRAHLAPFLPGHPVVDRRRAGDRPGLGGAVGQREHPDDLVGVHPMMGAEGCAARPRSRSSTPTTWRAAEEHYPVLYTRQERHVRARVHPRPAPAQGERGVEVEDVAKRLMDYGFHAPTMSFPVAGTLMIEPTESESLAELDRFCDAMIAIREEIREIEEGKADRVDNPLKNAPHTADGGDRRRRGTARTRASGGVPGAVDREHKFWPPSAASTTARRPQPGLRVPADGTGTSTCTW
jgi:glycine dehydrogenase